MRLGVCVSNPYLVAFAKKRSPKLEVAVSSANGIDSHRGRRLSHRRGSLTIS